MTPDFRTVGIGWWGRATALPREQWTAAGIGAAYLAFFVGFPWAFLAGLQGHTLAVFFGVSSALKIMLALPLLALGATAYLAVRLAGMWAVGYGSVWDRVGLTVVVLAGGACGVLLHYWNLLGWRF